MNIRFMIDGQTIGATLLDNPTARDFLSLLPLTLTLDDYAGIEKVNYLARRLSTTGAPVGDDPNPGDIAYYAPWGNLVIYYKDAPYADGVIKLGRLDPGGVERFSARGSMKVTMTLLAKRAP